MDFPEYIAGRSATRRMQVQHVTVRKQTMNIFGKAIFVDKAHTELARPSNYDNKSLFVQVLMVKLKDSACSTWEDLLGLLQHWRAIQGTIALAKSLWKEYTRAMKRIGYRGYSVQ